MGLDTMEFVLLFLDFCLYNFGYISRNLQRNLVLLTCPFFMHKCIRYYILNLIVNTKSYCLNDRTHLKLFRCIGFFVFL